MAASAISLLRALTLAAPAALWHGAGITASARKTAAWPGAGRISAQRSASNALCKHRGELGEKSNGASAERRREMSQAMAAAAAAQLAKAGGESRGNRLSQWHLAKAGAASINGESERRRRINGIKRNNGASMAGVAKAAAK